MLHVINLSLTDCEFQLNIEYHTSITNTSNNQMRYPSPPPPPNAPCSYIFISSNRHHGKLGPPTKCLTLQMLFFQSNLTAFKYTETIFYKPYFTYLCLYIPSSKVSWDIKAKDWIWPQYPKVLFLWSTFSALKYADTIFCTSIILPLGIFIPATISGQWAIYF